MVKVALAQINATVGDLAGNRARIVEFSRRAFALGARLVLEWCRPLRFELRDRLLVSTQIKPRPQRESEVGAVGGNAVAGKHPADGDRTEIGKQLDQEIAIHFPSSRLIAQRRATARRPAPSRGR